MNNISNEINIYTDGGCSGNPGIGAWAFYVVEHDVEKNGNEILTTNNKMELSAAIQALLWAVENNISTVSINTDSKYVQQGITVWIHNWKKNGWKTATKKPVKNQELWQELDLLINKINVKWNWVEGHAGHEGNERAHLLVTQAINALKP